MPVSAETLRRLIAAGLSGDALVAVVESIDADMTAVVVEKPRSAAAVRQERYRARHHASVTSDASRNADDPSPKEAPPHPLRNNPFPEKQTHTSPAAGSRIRFDWQPDPAGVAFAAEQGLGSSEITAEVEAFRDHWLRVGEPQADWAAAWRGWVRNGLTRRKPAKGGPQAARATPPHIVDSPKVNTPSGPRSVAFLLEQHRAGKWSRVYGPPIGERGCAVPAEMVGSSAA